MTTATTIATRDAVRPIDLLWEADIAAAAADGTVRGGALPADLAARYGGRLEIPLHVARPTIVVNFVSTLDGAVALDRTGASGGREISGASEPDRFVMGLLRASADAVLVGAGTVRSSRTHSWTAGHIHPPSAAAYDRWRAGLGLTTTAPTTVMVSTSGDLEARHLGLDDPDQSVIVVTTTPGARRLRATLATRDDVEIVAVADEGPIPAASLIGFLRERGFGLVLCEGGPTLFADLVAARAVDELFLTVAPQVVGRSTGVERLALVEGTAFAPHSAPWTRLRSVRRADDHLFLRYAFDQPHQGGMS
jgi:riboflavin biosynthesis pyrimidine reductase